MDSTPIVTVRGEAQLEGAPDLATLGLTVHRWADTAERVRADLADASIAVKAAIEPYAAAVARLSTRGLEIYPRFDQDSGGAITGYEGSLTTEVAVRDFDSLSELISALVALPNSNTSGPAWSLRRDNPAYRAVRLAAITEARQRAEDYAAAFGLAVGELLEVSDLSEVSGGKGGWQAQARRSGVSADEPSSFDLAPATQTVTAQVTVRMALV